MSNPHVEILIYAFESLDDRHDFSRAAPWTGDMGDFECRLVGAQLEARPRSHYPSIEKAREALEPHLVAWELWSELKDGIRIRFKARSARLVDTASGAVAVEVETASAVAVAGDATVRLGHGFYPPPSPKALATSPLVEELLEWVRELRERRQRLLVIAYLFLSRLEFEYLSYPGRHKRDKVAGALNVSRRVLDRLGELTEKSDPAERRKVKGPPDPLSEDERQWILAVLPRLVQQVAAVAAGSRPPQLTMADPDIPNL
jgi:hypothetical protein